MSPKFQVYKDAVGKFRFRIRAENNKIVAVGEAYEKHVSCINGIKSVKKNCNSEIEDLTIEGKRLVNPKYQVFRDAAGKFRFHLKASNGEVIAQGEVSETKDDCLNGIEVVKKSYDAEIGDLSVAGQHGEDTISSSMIEDLVTPPKLSAVKTETDLPEVEKGDLTQTAPILPVKTEIPRERAQQRGGRAVNVLLEFVGLSLIFIVAGLIVAFAFGGV